MAFKRIATLDVQTIYASDGKEKFAWKNFVKQANEVPNKEFKLPQLAYKFDTDHFLYLTARMISGMEKWGHNGNYDAFPWEEIKKSANTAIGKGFYIEHKEDSEEDAKGIILDVFPNDEDEYLVALCCIDKEEFPEFVQQILDGTYNQVSMSCLANECECSLCGNVAHSFDELCQHMNPNLGVTYLKGKQDDKGNDIYEINRDICFTGLSSVAVPADKDAFVFDIKASKKKQNRAKEELAVYHKSVLAGKMKEFKTACEEQFKSLDTVALLNKLQNCATTITNQVVDQNAGAEVINGPLQGILKQLMELQIGLTILDLNKLATPEVQPAPTAVGEPIVETKQVDEVVEEEKAEDGHLLTNDELEEVNFDKEIDSMLKQIKSDNDLYSGPNIIDAYKNLQKAQRSLKTLLDAGFISQKSFNDTVSKLEDMTSMLYAPVFKNRKVNFDKEIESYDNWSYTPFSSTATKKQVGTYFLKDHKQLQQFIDDHGEDIRDIRITKDGTGYRVFFENEYGRFHDDVYLEKYSSLDKIIEDTYK